MTTATIASPAMRDNSFELHEWRWRRIFVAFINKAARELGIDITWLSDHWVAKLEKDGLVRYIHGYIFPLNNSASGAITRDKVSTYETLNAAGVPAVPHYLARLTSSQLPLEATAQALRFAPFPLVVKPAHGFGGHDVHRVNSMENLELLVTELATRYELLTISPFVRIQNEYRVVMCDNHTMLVFEKVLPDGKTEEWRHNLRLGATPQMHTEPHICHPLEAVARDAMQALDLRLAAVDIVRIDGKLHVLEINQGISLSHFAAHTPMYALQAFKVYKSALALCFKL